MVETITAAVSPALDHIIERPRLIARLEEGGGSRVAVFAAPAGYGKTTLARQWSQRQRGPVAWYRTTRASGDVALLAVQFDELLASVAPELPREPRKIASMASVNPSPKPLGRAILRTFATLTQDVLLVVDEWEAAATEEAEELLAMLVEGLDVRFVITTRTRPDWFTPRLEVYGEGLEIGAGELAMTDEEATQVLAAVGAVAGRARVMRSADGWPAVLGLAAMSGDVDFTSSRLLSHTLYDFLASELLAAASPETQFGLMLLAVSVGPGRRGGATRRRRKRGRGDRRRRGAWVAHRDRAQVSGAPPAPPRAADAPIRRDGHCDSGVPAVALSDALRTASVG